MMKRMFRNFAVAAALALGIAGQADAALVRFDTGGLVMSDGTGFYVPTGTFDFDSDTNAVFNVNVTTPFATYVFGTIAAGPGSSATFDLGALSGHALDIAVSGFAGFLAGLASAAPGDEIFLGANPTEFDPLGTQIGLGIDPTLKATVLPPPSTRMPAVPLPAGLPLLLGALGGLGLVRMRKRA